MKKIKKNSKKIKNKIIICSIALLFVSCNNTVTPSIPTPTENPSAEEGGANTPSEDGDSQSTDGETSNPAEDGDSNPADGESNPNKDDGTQQTEEGTNNPTEQSSDTTISDIENSAVVKGLKDLGFSVDCVDVEPVEGLYTPETGDLVDFKFVLKAGCDFYALDYQLDRENSTKDNLMYTCTCVDTYDNSKVDESKVDRMWGNTLKFNKDNYSVQFSATDEENFATMKLKLNDDARPEFILNCYDTCYQDMSMEVAHGQVFKPPGAQLYEGFEIKLAK